MRPQLFALALALACAGAAAQDVPAARQAELLRLLRQDCGSCHGMRLTGGLGPALTRQALAALPPDSLAATIYHGRPGTPMPPWNRFMSADEAQWLARQLLAGVPEVSP
ncbi:c-type cytochrome [Azohydromonas lata]|uniref:Cytochrome c n=1 Tax=Azohydromonas lata TaxID=45677 RepID=A0ABU5IFL1_9BURK|nr:cytochrome c [Azohydromonas lata]MDZ5457762.1 cytochrome c [Azohydromonas lata]